MTRKAGPHPGGRIARGDRQPTMVRIPLDHYDVIAAKAAQEGLCMSDYICAVLCTAHDLDEPAYIQVARDRYQERLELDEKKREAAGIEQLPIAM